MLQIIKNKYFLLFTFLTVLLIYSNPVLALEVNLGNLGPNPTLPEYVIFLFSWGISIAGVLSLISFTIGAIGLINPNVEAHGEAKDRMKGAVLGLALTLASYLIIITINPTLATPTLNPLTPVVVPPPVVQPGIYYYLDSGCSGDSSGANTNSQDKISDPYFGKIKSIKIVDDPANRIYYGAIFHDSVGLKNGGACSEPIKDAGCHNTDYVKTSAVDIFRLNSQLGTSGNGVSFYSRPFGQSTGTNAGFYDIEDNRITFSRFYKISSDTMCFDYTGVNEANPYKYKCTDSTCHPGNDYSCTTNADCASGTTCDGVPRCVGRTCKYNNDPVCNYYPDMECNTEIGRCVGSTNPSMCHTDKGDSYVTMGACVGQNGKKLCSNLACESFQDCPQSMAMDGSYLVALYSKISCTGDIWCGAGNTCGTATSKICMGPHGPTLYCQTFTQDVPNFKVQPILSSGTRELEEVYIIPTK